MLRLCFLCVGKICAFGMGPWVVHLEPLLLNKLNMNWDTLGGLKVKLENDWNAIKNGRQ